MRILIIDDDDVARELLSGTLKQSGHHVFELATAIGRHARSSSTTSKLSS